MGRIKGSASTNSISGVSPFGVGAKKPGVGSSGSASKPNGSAGGSGGGLTLKPRQPVEEADDPFAGMDDDDTGNAAGALSLPAPTGVSLSGRSARAGLFAVHCSPQMPRSL